MSRHVIKNASCSRAQHVVTVRLECTSLDAANKVFNTVAAAIKSGGAPIDISKLNLDQPSAVPAEVQS